MTRRLRPNVVIGQTAAAAMSDHHCDDEPLWALLALPVLRLPPERKAVTCGAVASARPIHARHGPLEILRPIALCESHVHQ
eukprot:8131431-Pyramimonas_sp.AAC.1